MIQEEWRTIEGYPDYQVSNHGRIKSFKLCKEGKLMKMYLNRGYESCILTNKEGKGKYVSVHRLIAIAFIPNPNGYPEINHKNGTRYDNRIENIEWCNRSQNAQHAYDILGHKAPRGEHNGAAKLTEEQVKEIYLLAWEGVLSQEEIAEMYDISQTVVANIKNGKWWSHVTNHEYIKSLHGSTKITAEQAKKIHYLAWNTNLSNKEIGRMYNISWFTVRNIKIGKLWQEVTGQQPVEMKQRHKLSPEEVLEIYNMAWCGKFTLKEIAKRFGVYVSTVSDIKLGKRWINITGHNISTKHTTQKYTVDTLDAWL